ncbi:conserved hypothetical protein [Histoplasma capsulatum H143]|uniref:Ribonuclease H1 N-terminal domain-containing protein n=1 Tax=Ajellomyces capsulatus (strain H143) TaxID=544712 RepID=C6H6M3_AJECH|nr:conserved hypothetical protein [Histoplasma capsulatum H143]
MVSQPLKGKNKKNKPKNEYYAVYKGRVDEPTIFSSWGDAHPRVTGCKAVHHAYSTIEEAWKFMEKHGVVKPKEILKEGAGETTSLPNQLAFYAVADGKSPGIHSFYCGKSGAEEEVKRFPGACHKVFRSRAQAEAFIEDWKNSYADIWWRAIREALDQGLRPADMKIKVRSILALPESGDKLDALKMDELSIKEETHE